MIEKKIQMIGLHILYIFLEKLLKKDTMKSNKALKTSFRIKEDPLHLIHIEVKKKYLKMHKKIFKINYLNK